MNLNPVKLIEKALVAALHQIEGDDLTEEEQGEQPSEKPSIEPVQSEEPSKGLVQSESEKSTTTVDAVPVERGVWIDASRIIDQGNATKRTEEFRRIVQTFDEDRQDKLAWLVGKFFTSLAYLLPLVIGWYAGLALGDTLSGTFTFAVSKNAFSHIISVGLELSIPMLGYAVAVSFKRASKDRSQTTACALLLLVFLAIAVANATAQEVLLYNALPQNTFNQQMVVWFRSLGPSIIDVISTVFIAIVGVRNLKKYLADQKEKIHAIREVSLVHIEMDKTTLQAAIDKQAALQDMQSKAKRADTWNQIEAMQADAMLENARRNMLGDGNQGGSYRRSRY